MPSHFNVGLGVAYGKPMVVGASGQLVPNLFGVTPQPPPGAPFGFGQVPPWLAGMPTGAIQNAMAFMAANGISPMQAQLQAVPFSPLGPANQLFILSTIVGPTAGNGGGGGGGSTGIGGGGGPTGPSGPSGPGGPAAPKCDRVLGALSRHFGGFIDLGSCTDKHRIQLDDEGRTINRAHIWCGGLFRLDDTRDGPLDFEKEPFPELTPSPVKSKVHLQWDNKVRKWRWWAESPMQVVTPPPAPPKIPPTTPPIPPQIPTTFSHGGTHSWNPGSPQEPYLGTTMRTGFPELMARPMPHEKGQPDFNLLQPSEESLRLLDWTTPITGKLAAFGAINPDGEWIYTHPPESARYPGGTANGGWVMMPPEADLLTQVPGFKASNTTLMAGLGTSFSAGVPSRPKGGIEDGFSWGTPAVGQPLTFARHSTTTGIPAKNDVFRMSPSGRFANRIGGFWGEFAHANTADRTWTFPNRSGTVALDILQRNDLQGFRLKRLSATTISVTRGTARDRNDNYDLETTDLKFVSLPADLDTGAEAANTWYAVHLIGDSTGTNPERFLFSTDFTEPTFPAGYNRSRRVGVVRNDSASDILDFIQDGSGSERRYIYRASRSVLTALSGGTSTTYANVSLTSFMPPGSKHVVLTVGFDTVNSGDMVELRPQGSGVADPSTFIQVGTSTGGNNRMTNEVEMLLPTRVLQYRITLGAGGMPDVDLYVKGFTDSIGIDASDEGSGYVESFPLEYSSTPQGTWESVSDPLSTTGQIFRNTTGVNLDQIRYEAVLQPGTYTLEVLGEKNANNGRMEVQFGGLAVASFDQYAASLTRNVTFQQANIVLASATKTIRVRANGKNVASSGFVTGSQLMKIVQTA